MLTISEQQMLAIADDARTHLRAWLHGHWRQRLATSLDTVGAARCAQLLDEMQALADEDPTLDLSDLAMLADLQLVALANDSRGAPAPAAH